MIKCYACKRDFELIQIHNDHRIPRSLGGDNSYRNKQQLCIACHHRKTSLEVSLFQFYTESNDIYEWLQLAFQGDVERIEIWLDELSLKLSHFREVVRSLERP